MGLHTAALFVMLSLCIGLEAQAPSSDFGFRFQYGDCAQGALDTFTGEYTRSARFISPDVYVRVPLVLPTTEMAAIEHDLDAAGYFDFAKQFVPVDPSVRETMTTRPSITYRLETRRRDQSDSVVWDDCCRPTTAQADRLRVVLQRMIEIIESRPELADVAKPKIGCM
jgi:hypothetical protein